MHARSLLFSAASLLFATSAHARADVVVDIASSTGDLVYDAVAYDVTVTNIGNRNADNVQLTVQLPETATSPTVHVLGNLLAFDGRCSQSGTQLLCSLGQIRKNRDAAVWFDLELPWSAAPLEVEASVRTSSREDSTNNNDDLHTASPSYYDVSIADGDLMLNEHCTGANLTAFFECTVSPSSISAQEAIFHGDGTISFPFAPVGYDGVWSQSSPDHLEFTYREYGVPVVEFVGDGVPGRCFEGLSTFPNSPNWVSPYSVCIQ
jgi:hypothetical protein